MTAQKGVYFVLVCTGYVLLLHVVGLSCQTPASAQYFNNATSCKSWNAALGKCQECQSGFTGRNCTIVCRYPSFGKQCQFQCNCDQKFCSSITGCKDGSPTLSRSSTTDMTKPTIIKTTTEKIICSVGFFGNNCETLCRFPSFGLHCRGKCDCSKEYCNHVKGCNGKKR